MKLNISGYHFGKYLHITPWDRNKRHWTILCVLFQPSLMNIRMTKTINSISKWSASGSTWLGKSLF